MHIRYHWPVYGGPGPDIQGRDVVCEASEPARPTEKFGLRFSVGLFDVPARRAFSAGVSRVDEGHRNTRKPGLVRDERMELKERPVRQACPLALPSRYPFANAFEIFEGNTATGALSVRHECLADLVVDVLLIASLFAADLQQLACGRPRALALKVAPAMGGLAAVLFDGSSRVDVPIAIRGNVDDAKVDTKHVRGLDQLGIVDLADGRQVEYAADKEKVGFPLASREQRTLALSAGERHDLTPIDSPDRDAIVGFEAQDTVVVGESAQQTEGASGLAVELVGVSDFSNAANDNLCGEPGAGSHGVINELVQSILSENVLVPSDRADLVADHVGLFERALQGCVLLLGRLELEIDDESHGFSLCLDERFVKNRKDTGIPLLPKGNSLLPGNL